MMLTGIGVLIVTVFLSFAGFLSAVNAAESMVELRGKRMKLPVLCVYIILNAIFGLFFGIAHPALYGVVLLAIAALQFVNHEGVKRRASWNILAAAYSVVLTLSTVAYFERNGKPFTPWALLIVAPIAAPFVIGAIRTHRLEKNKAETKKDDNIVAWIVVAILIIIVAALVAINLNIGR